MKIKRLLLFVLLVLSACINTAYADNKCIVNVNSNLNVRFYPSKSGKILGTLNNGDTIDVYSIDNNGWAEVYFNGETGYVKAKYLTEIDTESKNNADENASSSNIDVDFNNLMEYMSTGFDKTNNLMFFYIALALWIIGTLCFKEFEELCKLPKRAYFTSSCFLLTFIFEIIYFFTYDDDVTWFCSPDKVGWGWTVINFLIFGFVTYKQCIIFIQLLWTDDYLGDREGNYLLGIFSYPVAFVALLISNFFFDNEYDVIIAVIFLLCHVVQIGIIIYQGVTNNSHPINIVLSVAIYITGLIATTILLFNFLILLVIVLIAIFFLNALGHKGVSSKYCSNCSHYSNGYCNRHDRSVSSHSVCDDFRY